MKNVNGQGNLTKQSLLIILICYFLVGIPLLFAHQYHTNTDGISYLDIAKSYLGGNFQQAVNSYWSPFYSWLIVPALSLKLQPILAAKSLNLLTGSALIGITYLFLGYFKISKEVKITVLITTAILSVHFALSLITPDLLLTVILLSYFYFIFSPSYQEKKSYAIYCGLLGGLAYLTKTYALPFFIVHFALVNILKKIASGKTGQILPNMAIGYLSFLTIVTPWILTVSSKENFLTIGQAYNYNHSAIGPQNRGYYLNSNVIIPPPNSQATSAWYNPPSIQKYLDIKPWSPFESISNFLAQLRIVLLNIINSVYLFEKFSLVSIPLLIYIIAKILKKPRVYLKKTPIIGSLITLIIYPLGYLLIVVEARYLWISFMLTLILSALVLDKIIKKISRLKLLLILLVFIISFTATPLYDLNLRLNLAKDSYITAMFLKEKYSIKNANIASNSQGTTTMVFAAYLESRFWGQTGELGPDAISKLLRTNNIDYYFVWVKGEELAKNPASYQKLIFTGIDGLKIYKLN